MSLYNRGMKILEPYISKEYLALKINYCKKQLSSLPEITPAHRNVRGVNKLLYLEGNHRYLATGSSGEELRRIYNLRTDLTCDLTRLEGLWASEYKRLPTPDIEPRKIKRRMMISDSSSVVLDGEFFESLKNDANPNHRENKTHYYNGTYYRSSAEVEIARFYTEQGIPFKYEPEIRLKGLNFPVYPDFVIYIEELDLCKFHEHFGMKNSSAYNRSTAVKYTNYSNAGLLPELDTIFTYDVDFKPFDLRELSNKLNSAVYGSLFCFDS